MQDGKDKEFWVKKKEECERKDKKERKRKKWKTVEGKTKNQGGKDRKCEW